MFLKKILMFQLFLILFLALAQIFLIKINHRYQVDYYRQIKILEEEKNCLNLLKLELSQEINYDAIIEHIEDKKFDFPTKNQLITENFKE